MLDSRTPTTGGPLSGVPVKIAESVDAAHYGIGGLIARREFLQAMPPYHFGGDMIEVVEDEHSTWNVLPHRHEAGTPNVAGAVGLAAAGAVVLAAIVDGGRARRLVS